MRGIGIACAIGIAAASGTARGEPLPVAEVQASSTLRGAGDVYAAFRAVDGTARTGWCEGRADTGIGEQVRVKLAGKVSVRQLKIFAGFWKSDALKAANNRPKSLRVTIDGQPTREIAVDENGLAVVDVGADVLEVAVVLGESRPGKVNDSCISEIEFWKSELTKLIPPAPPKKWAAPKGKLACSATLGDGTKVDLPHTSKPRLEQPVTCALSIAAPHGEMFNGVLQTGYALGAGKQRVKKDGAPRSGLVEMTPVASDKKTLTATFHPEGDAPDFESCLDFGVEARLEDNFGRAAWTGRLAVKQYCPD